MELDKEEISENTKMFFDLSGRLLLLSALLGIKRRSLLAHIHRMLPFWYSIPPFVAVMRFLSGKKKQTGKKDTEQLVINERSNTIQSLIASIVPENHTIDSYLSKLQTQWNKSINSQNRQNFIEDVNSLVRDRLRLVRRTLSTTQITQNFLDDTVAGIVSYIPSLNMLSDKQSLERYIKLYILKLLSKSKS
jgi:hypothetical protein